MSSTSAPAGLDRVQDEAARQRVLRRLAGAPTPWLHQEVARRMAERLPLFRLQPQTVLAWDAAWGGGVDALVQAFPSARCLVVHSEPTAARADAPAPASQGWRRWLARASAARSATEATWAAQLPAAQAQLVWSNMGLHHAGSVRERFADWHRTLQTEGLLMFSTLGPGSLQAVRDAHARLGAGPAHAPFIDMHDLGDLLVEAGFADPVMDQEMLTLTWSSAQAMLAELRTLGGNTHPARHGGLRTARWRDTWMRAVAAPTAAVSGATSGALSDIAEGQRVSVTLEVVYGHAFKGHARADASGEAAIPLQEMRRALRRRRTGGGAAPAGAVMASRASGPMGVLG